MTLREFLAILRQRWMTIVASALIVLAGTALATLSITPTYTASARVYFSTEAAVDDETGQRGGVYVLTQSDLTTYIEVLNSPTVIGAISTDVGATAGFSVVASPSTGAAILDITATSSNPEVAAAVANAAGPQLAAVAPQFSALLANAGQTVTSTFISEAGVPTTPTSPNVTRNLTLGLLFGVVLGIGLAFIRNTLDTRVRGEDDLKTLSDRPVLAAIPFDRASIERPIIMEAAPFSPHAEEFRKLRANLMFVDVATASHSFVVTSAVPSEGKTTTAVNLAIAMADAGARVLLIDGDLRNPSVANTMGIDGEAGLTTILVGRARIEDVIQPWKDTTLSVLPAGAIPPNPSELLGSEAMRRLFQDLTSRFDYVLVDSPPVVPVIDAVLLNKLTGGTLLVVSLDRIRKRYLAHAIKSLHTAGAHISGFALNMVPVTSSGPYYGYGYGYHAYGTQAAESQLRDRRRRRDSSEAATGLPEFAPHETSASADANEVLPTAPGSKAPRGGPSKPLEWAPMAEATRRKHA